ELRGVNLRSLVADGASSYGATVLDGILVTAGFSLCQAMVFGPVSAVDCHLFGVRIDRTEFLDDVDFSDARLDGGCHITGTTFHGGFIGNRLLLDGKLTWPASIRGAANFAWAVFPEGTNLSGATFGGDASFSGAHFLGRADLNDVTFE